jgi:CelD/BcsL family acetyltransferase involved in cellulose biosynthesis
VLLERLFERSVRRYYMGPGENAYKERWSGASEPVQWLAVYGKTLRGRLVHRWERSLRPLVRAVRSRVTRSEASNDERGD